jgi:hypothetical protein
MNRVAWTTGLIIITGLVIIQFFRPERNTGGTQSTDDIQQVLQVPDTLALVLENSCFDCHSNHTRYPWYSQIAPVSWYLASHIRLGRDQLNLSEFGRLEKSRKIGALSDICEMVEAGSMPLKSYLFIHRDARISEKEAEAICDWSESASLGILRGDNPK